MSGSEDQRHLADAQLVAALQAILVTMHELGQCVASVQATLVPIVLQGGNEAATLHLTNSITEAVKFVEHAQRSANELTKLAEYLHEPR